MADWSGLRYCIVSVLVALCLLMTGCSSQVVVPASSPDPGLSPGPALSPQATAPAAALPEPTSARPDEPAPAAAQTPAAEEVAPTPEPPTPVESETATDDEEARDQVSIDLPRGRAVGGNLRAGDQIMLFANRGPTLDRSSIDLLGDFELLEVNVDFIVPDDGAPPVAAENLTLVFNPGSADLSGLDEALANDLVLVMGAGTRLFATVELDNERALAGEIEFGDTVQIARLDGTVLADQAEILNVQVDVEYSGLPDPVPEIDEFVVTLGLLDGELLDLAMAILADDIQLVRG